MPIGSTTEVQNRAFIINSGAIPGTVDPVEYYNSFAVVQVNGSGSRILESNKQFVENMTSPAINANAVAVKSDGKQAYFTCPGLSQVKYVDTVNYNVNEIDDSTGQPAVITNPIDIALGTVWGTGKDYFTALKRLVEQIPLTAYNPADPGGARNLMIAAIDAIIDCYEPPLTMETECSEKILSALQTAQSAIEVVFYRTIVLDKLNAGLTTIKNQAIVSTIPETYTLFLQDLLAGMVDSSFDDPAARQDALLKAQQATDQLNVRHYDAALALINDLETIIIDHLHDATVLTLIRELIDGVQASITDIYVKFGQASSGCGSMAATVTGLPNSAFQNNVARQSLLNHIDQTKADCNGHRLDQAMQKANLVRSDISAKIIDANAQANLLGQVDQIISILQGIGQ